MAGPQTPLRASIMAKAPVFDLGTHMTGWLAHVGGAVRVPASAVRRTALSKAIKLDVAELSRPAPISLLLPSFMPRKMSDEQIEAYLDSRPGWAILSTIDEDGFPHSVPLGYFRLGRDIVMGVRDGTHKIANIESNPNVSVLLEDGSSMADIRGVMCKVTLASFAKQTKHFSSPGKVPGDGACRSQTGPPHPDRAPPTSA